MRPNAHGIFLIKHSTRSARESEDGVDLEIRRVKVNTPNDIIIINIPF